MRDYSLPIVSTLGRHSCRPFHLDDRSPWTQGRKDLPGKTRLEAMREHRNLANLLSRSERWEGAGDVAAHLMRCTALVPCLSGACPCCNLSAQRLMVALMGHPLARTRSDLAMGTVINTRRRGFGALRGGDLYGDFRRSLVDVLDDLGISAVGGFELSLNTTEDDRYEPFFAEQCHFFCSKNHEKRLRKALKQSFEPTDAVLRPVRIETFDRMAKGVAYVHKNRTQWRIGLIRRPERGYSTRWKPLPSEARVEVALAQHTAGLDANVLAVGFRLVALDGQVRLVRRR